MRQRLGLLLGVASLAVCIAASCGSAPAPNAATAPGGSKAPTAPASQPTRQKVTLRMAFLVRGYDAPFALALENGYFRDAGFDVDLQEGKGSLTTAETVGNGSDAFGEADGATVAKAISKGVAVKVIGAFVQHTPFGFIYHPGTRLDSVADLNGKTLITTAGDANLSILPAVLAKQGMSMQQVHLQMTDPTAYTAAFLKDPKAILLGGANGTYTAILKAAPDAKDKTFADFGVNVLSMSIITNVREIAQHPDDVKRFMAAVSRGWQATIADPTAAVDATLKVFSKASRQVISSGLERTLPLLHTPASEGHPLGWMAASDWQDTVNMLHQYAGMKTVKPLNAYYANDYIPQSSS